MSENILTGAELETHGANVFKSIGLICEHDLNHVSLAQIDPGGGHSSGQHMELDYLIPCGDICLAGEITSRSNPSSLKGKYTKFRRHIRVLRSLSLNDDVWRQLGVSSESISKFSDVGSFRGIFVATQLEKHDVELQTVANTVNCFRSDWQLIEGYADTIGEYARQHFLHSMGVGETPSMESITVNETDHSLSRTTRKKVASGGVPTADVYTFEINPYSLLRFAQVYRRDGFPGAAGKGSKNYQRPLNDKKLRSMRKILSSNMDFMYPNNILCVLSDDCDFVDGELKIPKKHGSLSVIDGQHRLFSFADEGIESSVEDPLITMTAIKFRNLDENEDIETQINEHSAYIFVEINRKQTTVSSKHLDFIKYDVLGQTDGRALAAKVILNVNERRGGKLNSFFDTHQTGLGIITPGMVITGLKTITNLKKVRRLSNSSRPSQSQHKSGYENLLNADIGELCNPEIMIAKCTVGLERFFGEFASVFKQDWPRRGEDQITSLSYAKVFFAFVKLFRIFMERGYSWENVKTAFERLRRNVRALVYSEYHYPFQRESLDTNYFENAVSDENVTLSRLVLFDSNNRDIPTFRQKKEIAFEFLERNLLDPTSTRTIVEEKILRKLN